MIFSKEQKRGAYIKLSQEMQNFIMSFEVTELVENAINSLGLSSDSTEQADTEIWCALLGLQTLDSAINNIAIKENKAAQDFSSFKLNLEGEVFSKLAKIKSEPVTPTESIKNAEKNNSGINIVEKKSGESVEANKPSTNIPSPIESKQAEEGKNIVSIPNYSNYDSGKDPYREPIE